MNNGNPEKTFVFGQTEVEELNALLAFGLGEWRIS
jgi:hypothetical protein